MANFWKACILLQLFSLKEAQAITTTDFVCETPSEYPNWALSKLVAQNCDKVAQAINEIDQAVKDDIYTTQGQKEVWNNRTTRARNICSKATAASTSPADGAYFALNAWGTVMMDGQECCSLLSPPFCVDRRVHGSLVAGVMPFALLAGLFITAIITSFVLRFIQQWRATRASASAEGAPPDVPVFSRAESVPPTVESITMYLSQKGLLDSASTTSTLQKELEDRWMKESSLRTMEGAAVAAKATSTLFATLQDAFDFQPDNVRNQYDHLLSLWRSQISMVADREGASRVVWEVSTENLLGTALGDLHAELLDGFIRWRQSMDKCEEATMPERDLMDLHWLGAVNRVKLTGLQDTSGSSSDIWLTAKLEEIVVFLLVWGEAGNVRFMPEVLYLVTELVLASGLRPAYTRAAGTTKSNRFLAEVIRPIYKVIFEEWYDRVGVNSAGKDDKVLKFGFGPYLPADVANYDDWNELFLDPPRLVKALVTKKDDDGESKRLFSVPHEDRFQVLLQVDWHASLSVDKVKTHREVHSLWGAFASTHRIWLLHSCMFLLGVVLMAGTHTKGPGQHRPLAGNQLPERLATATLILPIHALLWWYARWQVTGDAFHLSWAQRLQKIKSQLKFEWYRKVFRENDCCRSLFKVVYNPPDWVDLLPIVTYASIRLTAPDDPSLSPAFAAIIVHYVVSAYALWHLLLRPNSDYMVWELSEVPIQSRMLRYGFWLLVLAGKFVLSLAIFESVHNAVSDLAVSQPGAESAHDILKALKTNRWWADLWLWFVLWSITFLLFNSDTQLWFTIACTFLGLATTLKQRAWHVQAFITEHAPAKIPSRFARKVMPYSKIVDNFSVAFPFVWDRIIEFMRYEDDIDGNMMGMLAFHSAQRERDSVRYADLYSPVQPELPEEEGEFRVQLPRLFNWKNASETCFKTYCGVPDRNEPTDGDVRWRLTALARGLGLPMARPYRAPYIPAITVLIPHYGEQILIEKKELVARDKGADVPLIHWLRQKYPEEFDAFTARMKSRFHTWPTVGDLWVRYSDEQWDKLCYWASMRLQTLFRTVAGMCLYYPALQCHYEMQADVRSPLAAPDVWKPEELFTCLVSMQMYKYFNKTQLKHTNAMFKKFPASFKVAFIDCEARGEGWHRDEVSKTQDRRYFSCLLTRDCPEDVDGRRAPVYRIELPGYPILGDGKGDNQNHAIPFMRGHYSQCIDANQGAYFEQMLMLPNALGEFRPGARGDGLSKRIVGFPEHITSDIGSIGDFAASAEVAFGTILQRTYSVLGARMHYGHPDIMNKVFMMQQGGVSKATKTINLSEDIFAGMDFTLRGDGRQIKHCEYFHLAKGRDMGFNAVLGFFSKLSSGTGEQLLSRQTFRLGQVFHLPEALAFYYAHAGYYVNQFFVSMSLPLLVFAWLLVLLSDCDERFLAWQHCPGDRAQGSAADVMATYLGACFSWLIVLFLVANTMPLLTELWVQENFRSALTKLLTSLCTLSPLMFVFQAKTIGVYITNEIRWGGATYVATGRGLPTERRPIIFRNAKNEYEGLYLDYAPIAYYDGATLLAGVLLVLSAGGNDTMSQDGLLWLWISVALTLTSWLYAPFIFNPYNFAAKYFWADAQALFDFFFRKSGAYWQKWYEQKLIKPRHGVRRSMKDVGFILAVLFLMAWYLLLNMKAEALISIFSEVRFRNTLYAMILVPPIFSALLYTTIVSVTEWAIGSRSAGMGGLYTAREWARESAARAMQTAEALGGARAAAARENIRRRLGRKAAKADVDAAPTSSMESPDLEAAATGSSDQPATLQPSHDDPAKGLVRARTAVFHDGMPLGVSAVIVIILEICEGVGTLWFFKWVGWHRAFLAGLILKWGLLKMCLFLMESILLSPSCLSSLTLPLHHWVRSNRIARDMMVSALVVVPQLPLVFLNWANDTVCPGCSVHSLLIYRDPGTRDRKEISVSIDYKTGKKGEQPPTVASMFLTDPGSSVLDVNSGLAVPPDPEELGTACGSAPDEAAPASAAGALADDVSGLDAEDRSPLRPPSSPKTADFGAPGLPSSVSGDVKIPNLLGSAIVPKTARTPTTPLSPSSAAAADQRAAPTASVAVGSSQHPYTNEALRSRSELRLPSDFGVPIASLDRSRSDVGPATLPHDKSVQSAGAKSVPPAQTTSALPSAAAATDREADSQRRGGGWWMSSLFGVSRPASEAQSAVSAPTDAAASAGGEPATIV